MDDELSAMQALLLYSCDSGIGGSPPEDSSIEGFRPQGSGTLIEGREEVSEGCQLPP